MSNKIKDTQDQLDDTIKRENHSRQKAIELLQTHDRVNNHLLYIFLIYPRLTTLKIEEKMKYEFEMRIRELDNAIDSLQEENRVLQYK